MQNKENKMLMFPRLCKSNAEQMTLPNFGGVKYSPSLNMLMFPRLCILNLRKRIGETKIEIGPPKKKKTFMNSGSLFINVIHTPPPPMGKVYTII